MMSDSMHIGSGTYVHFHKKFERGIMSARIINDSVLTIYDEAGVPVDYPVQSWVFSTTKDSAYREVRISGAILPNKCVEWINEQSSGRWICIEGVVVLMPDGTERTLVGEKWVKI